MSTGGPPTSSIVPAEGAPDRASRGLVERARREGHVSFLGVDLLVAPGALVPRPETEILGRTAMEALAAMAPGPDGVLRVVDMCCGSGNLACALAAADSRVQVLAADLTDECVTLARRNAEHVGVSDRVRVFQGDLFAALPLSEIAGRVAAIVCNPPYISTGRLARDRAGLIELEPVEAFDGGPYGLSIHQRVIKDAVDILRGGGRLLFELGTGQDRQIRLLFNRAVGYVDLSFVADGEGRPRVVMATRTPSSVVAGDGERQRVVVATQTHTVFPKDPEP